MRTQQRPGGEPTVTLRTSVFKQAMRDLGHKDVQARADFIGMHRSSLVRLEAGETLPGMRFLAFTLEAFRSQGLGFYDLFEEVHTEPAERAA